MEKTAFRRRTEVRPTHVTRIGAAFALGVSLAVASGTVAQAASPLLHRIAQAHEDTRAAEAANAVVVAPAAPATHEIAALESDDAITNHTLRSDRLAVTVAKVANGRGVIGAGKPEMDIWVGEVDVKGRKAVWVELIDTYGEVIYDAEVIKNQTHLLPDGRAIVVKSLDDDATTAVAKADNDRLDTDSQLVITRRVVEDGDESATVEFLQETSPQSQAKPGALVAVATFGDRVWAAVSSVFSSAADNVRYAFAWMRGA